MNASLPLPTLLSHALVAFTIEFDNEAERQLPHRTTNHGSTVSPGPWLVSMAMFLNCMQFVGEEGISVGELERLARTQTKLNGMEHWGYISVAPDPADRRPKPPHSAWVIRATRGGRKAQQTWRPLFDVVENRWQERFGAPEIAALRESLSRLISQMELDLPDCLPILGYGLYSQVPDGEQQAAARQTGEAARSPWLPALLAKVLLAFALEFERESEVSLAIAANVLRLFSPKNGAEAVRVKDMPRLSGVSKEAIATALSFLTKRGYARVESESSGSKTKVLRLTRKGEQVRDVYHQLVPEIEKRWQQRFGKDAIHGLRQSLEPLVGEPDQKSPLFRGLDPYPENWRASIPRPTTLPHYPMVLHRGGYPDGS